MTAAAALWCLGCGQPAASAPPCGCGYYARANLPPCATCGAGRLTWPHPHPLNRRDSPDCPACITAAIDDDKRHERNEDL